MPETYIIQRSDFDTYHKKLSGNINFEDDVKPSILEAQFHDLRPLITKDFYNEVLTVAQTGSDSGNLTFANYQLLLPYLKPVIVYYAYARYIQSANYRDGRYGKVVKQNPYSREVSASEIDRQAQSERSKAIDHYHELREYLENNTDKFSTYNTSQQVAQTNPVSVRIHTIDE